MLSFFGNSLILISILTSALIVIKSILVSEDSGNADTITVTITDTSDAVFSLFKTLFWLE